MQKLLRYKTKIGDFLQNQQLLQSASERFLLEGDCSLFTVQIFSEQCPKLFGFDSYTSHAAHFITEIIGMPPKAPRRHVWENNLEQNLIITDNFWEETAAYSPAGSYTTCTMRNRLHVHVPSVTRRSASYIRNCVSASPFAISTTSQYAYNREFNSRMSSWQ